MEETYSVFFFPTHPLMGVLVHAVIASLPEKFPWTEEKSYNYHVKKSLYILQHAVK